jgi:23S rRNA (cytosine1962-C5)-methyltransferase
LKALADGGEQFEVVILDPPAFIKRKKDIKEGLIAYRRLNKLALQVLEPGGVVISASCSYHLERQQLLEQIRLAQPHANLQLLEQGHQAPDHPVHPAIPETDYLKAYFLRLLES